MDCTNCELSKVKFYCENCLRNHLREYKSAIGHVTGEKNVQIDKAKQALEVMKPTRTRKAYQAVLTESISRTREQLQRHHNANKNARSKLLEIQTQVAARRELLQAARSHLPTPSHNVELAKSSIELLQKASADMSLALARARAGLVQELVEVFDIVEVGGRPSLGGKPGVKGEWRIAGGVLPVPGDVRRYPPDQINATLQHTLQFLSLLTYYLGIKLPFDVYWSKSLLTPGVGHPFISAGPGGDHGGWAKWTDEHPLHIIPLTSPANNDKEKDKNMGAQSFTTGFAMLLYNVAYLAYTQGIEVTLSQSGEVLRNLWAVCCSAELGKRSHASSTQSLPLPTPPSFPLDFTQLLQVTTATPPARTRHGYPKIKSTKITKDAITEEDGEWDLV